MLALARHTPHPRKNGFLDTPSTDYPGAKAVAPCSP
ncbi:hypothetical protein CLV68_6129 [Actinokineospora cianjurensis]|uniref:Uncharacterized protein n=1 Tax=Actinokineospora cianjurensis TaxID=585224 RepID=A0A421AWR4_9PSEU|nr:hypothetical protein CLV68_6129 [Actinokineospora cianjurensis]